MDSIRVYFRYIGISLRGQMQYKASFIMMAAGNFILSLMEFVAVWALFDRFKNLRGWTLPEAAILYGMVNVSFALAELVADGFDSFSSMVKTGDFDRLLLRPRSTVLQLMGQNLRLMRLGRLAQGFLILLWGAFLLHVEWSPAKLLLLVGSIIGGVFLFIGLFVFQATVAFWTVESLEIFNTATYGGVETAQFPLSIYRPWLRRFFTFVVPLACINYFPSLAILGRTAQSGVSEAFCWVAPVIGVMFLVAMLQFWKIGVRHYCSTGS